MRRTRMWRWQALVLAALFPLGLLGCQEPAVDTALPAGEGQAAVASPAEERTGFIPTEGTWSQISQGAYHSIALTGEGSVLQRQLSEADYAAIQEQLVDPSRPADRAAAEQAARNPDAVPLDNLLPDGRYRKEGWWKLEANLLAQRQDCLARGADGRYAPVSGQTVQLVELMPREGSPVVLGVERIPTGYGTALVPVPDLWGTLSAVLSPDGAILVAGQGNLWQIRQDAQEVRLVVPSIYQGVSYREQVAQSLRTYDENRVVWCEGVCPSPDSRWSAYVANKADLSGGRSLFLCSLIGDQQETLLRPGAGGDYGVEGWLDQGTILCTRTQGEDRIYTAVTLDGAEIELTFAIPEVQLVGHQGDLVAYTNLENDTLYVGRYCGEAALEPVGEWEVGGTLRLQGNDIFSPEGSRVAVVCAPQEDSSRREGRIFPLDGGPAERLSPPEDQGALLSLSWLDEGALLAVTQAGEDSVTWQCTLPR